MTTEKAAAAGAVALSSCFGRIAIAAVAAGPRHLFVVECWNRDPQVLLTQWLVAVFAAGLRRGYLAVSVARTRMRFLAVAAAAAQKHLSRRYSWGLVDFRIAILTVSGVRHLCRTHFRQMHRLLPFLPLLAAGSARRTVCQCWAGLLPGRQRERVSMLCCRTARCWPGAGFHQRET